jgi:hypothetical protein
MDCQLGCGFAALRSPRLRGEYFFIEKTSAVVRKEFSGNCKRPSEVPFRFSPTSLFIASSQKAKPFAEPTLP